MRELAGEGSLKPSHLVWKDGMPDWTPARSIPGLFPNPDVGTENDAAPAKEPRETDDRPRRRRYEEKFDDDDDARPRRKRRPDDDERDDDHRESDERDDYDDRRRSRGRPRQNKPGPVQAVSIMMLVGGILGLLVMLGSTLSSGLLCCLWPGMYFEMIMCILMIIRASNMLNADDLGPPRGLAICQICFIVNFDILNMVLGIVILTLLGGDEARRYYQRRGFDS